MKDDNVNLEFLKLQYQVLSDRQISHNTNVWNTPTLLFVAETLLWGLIFDIGHIVLPEIQRQDHVFNQIQAHCLENRYHDYQKGRRKKRTGGVFLRSVPLNVRKISCGAVSILYL